MVLYFYKFNSRYTLVNFIVAPSAMSCLVSFVLLTETCDSVVVVVNASHHTQVVVLYYYKVLICLHVVCQS